MSEMIERVALAVADHLGVNLAFTEAMESDTSVVAACRKADTARALAIARAAIEAMRLPTETMTEAGAVQSGGATKEQAIEWAKLDKFESRQFEAEGIFTAMIDAALAPPSEE